MNVSVFQRARSSWLLAFGDVITLLLTFFIVTIVMHKTDISQVDKWVQQQLDASYQQLNETVASENLTLLKVHRESRGILLTINSEQSFPSGSYDPSEELQDELQKIAQVLPSVPVLRFLENDDTKNVIQAAAEQGLEWRAEVAILGHTDNDWVNPESRLRNNFLLSTLRAESVMRQLQSDSGLPKNHFSIAGFSEWQPLVANASVQSKQLNRRVEILITAGFWNSAGPEF